MKNLGKALVALVVVVIVTAFILTRHRPQEQLPPPLAQVPSNHYHMAWPENARLADMPEERRVEFTKMFEERLKPAVDKWCKAYDGRVPFKPEDVTLDKYNSMLGTNLYTFMIGKTTLTIEDDGDAARVAYMMTRGGATLLNSIPHNAQQPDLSVPVTREQILEMVKADRGVSFEPDKVQILPSGQATALDGGALVSVNKTYVSSGGELLDGKSFTMVFAKNGKLINYEGPLF